MKNLFLKLICKFGFVRYALFDQTLGCLMSNIESSKKLEDELRKQILKLRTQLQDKDTIIQRSDRHYRELYLSRFVEVLRAVDGTLIASKITESEISHRIDMSDCYGDECHIAYMYLDNDGQFYPVTTGNYPEPVGEAAIDEFYQENPTTIFSQHGDLIANDKTVGHVRYTDH